VLGVDDVVRITVCQNPDLTTEACASENGPDQQINFPPIGAVTIGGLSVEAAGNTTPIG
jgi:protein involved in polysaccharide export with SLBB domain